MSGRSDEVQPGSPARTADGSRACDTVVQLGALELLSPVRHLRRRRPGSAPVIDAIRCPHGRSGRRARDVSGSRSLTSIGIDRYWRSA
jgi:hypothetical protein